MRRILDWFFRDRRTGAIVIGQWPNLPLWLFVAIAVPLWLVDATDFAVPRSVLTGLRVASLAALAWWAIDEIVRGANPWRRCLGATVLAFGVWSVVGRG